MNVRIVCSSDSSVGCSYGLSVTLNAVCSSNSNVGCFDGGGVVVDVVMCEERRPTLVAQ